MYTSDSATGSTDEYETDNYHPPSDDEANAKFLKGGRLSRSPDRVPPRGARSSPRRTSPRRAGGSSRPNSRNGNAGTVASSNKKPSSSSRRTTSTPSNKKPTASDDSYAGDDSDYDSDINSQKYKLGTFVSKQFEDGKWYSGKVTQYFTKDKLYTVTYEDDDVEDYNEQELSVLIANVKKGRGVNNGKEAKGQTMSVDSDDSLEVESDTDRKSAKQTNVDSASGSEDSDEDPFAHLGRSNKNKRKIVYSDDSESEGSFSSGDKRKAGKKKMSIDSDSDDSSEDYLSNTRKRPPPKKNSAALDSDSDSSIEIMIDTPKKPAARTSPRRSSSNRSASKPSPKKRSPPKSTASTTHNAALRAESENTLEQSRAIMAKLKNAQKYHAEELEEKLPTPSRQSIESVYDVDDSSDMDVMDAKPAASSAAAAPIAPVYTGDLLRLTLRYKDFTTKSKEVVLRIKSDEPLTSLNDKFQGGTITSLLFDGRKLDMSKTPQSYDMEDEDLVDATVTGVVASRCAASDVVKLLVQRVGTASSHEFGLPKTVPLSKLVEAVCDKFKVPSVVLEYNGRKLDPLKSCQAQGISSHVTIDAIVAKTIQLEFRVNGDSKDVHKINVLEKGTFKHAMDAFVAKKKCSITDCKFLFDGDVLQPFTSMESLDLEGGEIIDVKLNVAAVANPPALQNNIRDVVMTDAAEVMISVKTVRNLSKTKPKSWKLSNADPINKLKQEYTNYYKSKGCKQVTFYFNNSCISVESKSFRELGIADGAKIYAMENGKTFR